MSTNNKFHKKPKIEKLHYKILWNLIKIIFAVGLIFIVISNTKFSDILDTFNNLEFKWLVVYCMTFYLSILVMARRYWIFLGIHIPFRETCKILIYQILIGNFYATSLGAVYYVAELRQKYKVGIDLGISSLVVARIWDFSFFLLSICISGWILWDEINSLHSIVYFAFIGMLMVILIIVFFKPLKRSFGKVNGKFYLDRLQYLRWIIDQLNNFMKFMGEIRGDTYWIIFIYSLILIGLMFLFTYASFRIFSIAISPWSVLFVMMLQQMMNIIPVQVFGGLGLLDITDLYLYGLFGITPSILASVIVSKRIFFYLINLSLLFTFPTYSFLNKKDKIAKNY